MGLLLACSITRADLLGEAVREEAAALDVAMPAHADGSGVGFYQSGEVLHRKRPQAPSEKLGWRDVFEGIHSDVAVAHVREATVGDGRAENTQPFRMRQWLFAHVGSLAGESAIRERLVESLPDFLRRNVRGQTDSELLFHVVLSFLHDSGHLDSIDVAHPAVLSALRSALTLVDRPAREVGAPPEGLALALTNGRQLYALQRGLPLAMVERSRLSRRESDQPGGRAGHDHGARYVIVASCKQGDPPMEYRELADNEVVCIDRDLNVTSEKL
jgi:glutamine amidotransferase